ncbi:MAG TPA: hypothetical protein VN922_22390, partial [Bacteroidia bacterium]|nr:hypothetical protein [Bacteroidia bacterium]
MKKFLLGLSLSLVFSAQAQIAYYDAIKLRSTIRWTYTWSPADSGTQVSITRPFIHPFAPGKHDTVFNSIQYTLDPATTTKPNPKISFTVVGADKTLQTILKQYYKGPSDTNSTTVCKSYSVNPYIKPYLDCDKIAAGGVNLLSQSISSAGSSIGGLDVTNIATGIADFLVERGKEELEVAFFDKIKTGLNTGAPELRVIFPKTSVLLDNFDTWQYSNILSSLRESFNKDLQSILGDMINLDTVKAHASYSPDARKRIATMITFFQKPESKILLSALEIGNGVVTGEKIPNIIDSIASKHFLGGYTGSAYDIVPNATNFIAIISNSIRSTNVNENYVNPDTLIASMKDSITRNLFMGLLYQQLADSNVKFGNLKVDSLLVTSVNYTTHTITYLQNLLTNAKDVNTAMNNLVAGKKKGEKDLSSYWSAIFQSANQFLKALDNTEVIDPKLKFPPEVQNVFNYSTQTLTISQDIASQNYNGALVSLLAFVNDFNQQIITKEPATGSTPAVNQQDISVMLKGMVKYVSFASNVVAAKTSDDVKNAIESFALPAGSYSIKR